MNRSSLVLWLTLTALLPLTAFAGGSGLRGGLGVQCAGESAPVVLEDHLLFGRAGGEGAIELDRFLVRISEVNRPLALAIHNQLRKNESPERWTNEREIYSVIDRANAQGPQTITWLARMGLLSAHLSAPYQTWRLLSDDPMRKMPDDCVLVQLAVTIVTSDLRTVGPLLLPYGRDLKTERQLKLLAFHEAVYATGAVWFGHESVEPTRNLIMALLRDPADEARVSAAVKAFVQLPLVKTKLPGIEPLPPSDGWKYQPGGLAVPVREKL